MKYSYTHGLLYLFLKYGTISFQTQNQLQAQIFECSKTRKFGKCCQQDSLNSQFNWLDSGAWEKNPKGWNEEEGNQDQWAKHEHRCPVAVWNSQLSQIAPSFSNSGRLNVLIGF